MPSGAARRLLADFRAFAGRRLILLWLLMIGGAFAEGVGIVMLVPLLALAGDSAATPALLAPAMRFLGGMGAMERFGAVLALFLSAMLIRAVLLYARDVTMARLETDYTADMRVRTASSLAALGWGRASRVGLSGMQSLLLTEIPRCVYAAHEAQMAAVATIMLIVQFGLATFLSPALAGAALLIILFGLTCSWSLLRKGRRRGFAISAHVEQSSSAGFRLHAGLKAALAQGTTAQFLREYGSSLSLLSDETIGYSRDRARFRAFASMAAAVAAVALLFIGDQWLELPLPVLGTLLVLFARMSGPAYGLQQSLHGFSAYAPAFDALERSVGMLRSTAPADAADSPPLKWSELRLERVSYTHEDSGFALNTMDFAIRAGEWVGIAGPSGGGKTTLVDVAVGLLPPGSGTLQLDGRPVGQGAIAGWRREIAYVGQNEMTFEGTVRKNLEAGTPGTAEDEWLWEALALVGLDRRVRQLPGGLDAPLGDRGSSFSGGERQRLAIARAVLRSPSLIVLDEATNALDPASEEEVIRRIQRREPRPAAILIAHRDHALQLCDRIVRIENGSRVDP